MCMRQFYKIGIYIRRLNIIMVRKKDDVTVLSHQVGDHLKSDTIKSVILDTIFKSQTAITSDSIYQEIESLFGVLIDRGQLEEAMEELIDHSFVHRDGTGALVLSDTMCTEMQLKQLESESYRKKAILEWAKENDVALDQENETAAIVDFFVRSVFIKHGANSYSLISGRQSSEQFEIDIIEENVLRKYSPAKFKDLTGKLKKILSYPFSDNTIHYLRDNARKATAYLASILSEDQISSLESHLSELIIYLDTNVIYRLLGLQGNERADAVEKSINFCVERGVKVRVSAETLKELNHVINSEAQLIIKYPTKSSLAKEGYRLRSTDNYVSTFWAENAKTGVSAHDFNQKYKNIELLLRARGIEVEPVVVNADPVINSANELYEKLTHIRAKSDSTADVIWHDAYNMAYIKFQQKVTASSAIETGCLFMTTDQSLSLLQRTDSNLKNNPEICISPSQILQIFAFNRAKIEYYDTFIKLFSSATINYYQSSYENQEIADIIGRLSQYQTIDDAVAIRILENQLLDTAYKHAETNEEKEEIIYEQLTHELESIVHEERVRSTSLLDENKSLYDERQLLNAKIDDLEQDFLRRESLIQDELKDAIKSKDSLSKQVSELKGQLAHNKMRSWFNRRLVSLLLGIVLLGIAIYCHFNTIISQEVTDCIKYVVGIISLAPITYGGKLLSKSQRKKEKDKIDNSLFTEINE